MKKRIFLFSAIILIILGLYLDAGLKKASAHELLPKELQEFIKNNPNASVEEIENFAKSSPSEYVQKFGVNRQRLLQILKNKNTSFLDNAYDFTRLGIDHILSGADHILFVLAILLTFASFMETLKLTGTFTLAHSITLVLAGAGILTLPSKIVEPLIALSISYVAIGSVFFRRKDDLGVEGAKLSLWRSEIPTVFFFGLFHGLGFAGLLKEIQIPADRFASSLLFFNVGIELGQLIIISISLPIIYLLIKKSWYPKALKVTAIIIGAIGLFWFIQRILT